MSTIHKANSLNNINDSSVVTSPEILNTPNSKKRKVMEKSSSDGQTTLDFGQKPQTPSSSAKGQISLKAKEYKSLLSKMEEISNQLQHVVKPQISVTL